MTPGLNCWLCTAWKFGGVFQEIHLILLNPGLSGKPWGQGIRTEQLDKAIKSFCVPGFLCCLLLGRCGLSFSLSSKMVQNISSNVCWDAGTETKLSPRSLWQLRRFKVESSYKTVLYKSYQGKKAFTMNPITLIAELTWAQGELNSESFPPRGLASLYQEWA